MKIILVGGILGFVIITLAFKMKRGKISRKDMNCKIEIEFENRKVELKAIIDTGNFLRDPITKIPVIIVTEVALTPIIPSNILNNLQKILQGKEVELGEYATKIRIIPFSSLGKENGLIVGLKVDTVKIHYYEETEEIKDIIIGIYDGKLSKSNKYEALLGLGILEEKITI